jgi:hypothetical protein
MAIWFPRLGSGRTGFPVIKVACATPDKSGPGQNPLDNAESANDDGLRASALPFWRGYLA